MTLAKEFLRVLISVAQFLTDDEIEDIVASFLDGRCRVDGNWILFEKNGQLHRDGDQPAVIWADGSKFWYRNGQLHRDGDQPAVISADGSKYWYRNDREYTPRDKV